MGVSVSTVTNALNGAPNVGGELRQAIIDKANELGYKPNFHARAMVKNGINIALISTRQPHQYIDMVMKGMKEEVERLSDYKINLKKYLYHDNMAAIEAYDCVKRMIADGADGVIFSASFTTDDYIDLLNDYVRKNNIPVIGTDEDVGLIAVYMQYKQQFKGDCPACSAVYIYKIRRGCKGRSNYNEPQTCESQKINRGFQDGM